MTFNDVDICTGAFCEIRKDGRKLKWNVLHDKGFFNKVFYWNDKDNFTLDKERMKLSEVEFKSRANGCIYNIKLIRNRKRVKKGDYFVYE